MRATKIRDLEIADRADAGGVITPGAKALYRMDPPLEGSEYVYASAATVLGRPECYLFACDQDGKVSNWTELDGSYQGGLSIETALRNAGYDVEATEDLTVMPLEDLMRIVDDND